MYGKKMLKLHEDLNNPQSLPHMILDPDFVAEIGITDAQFMIAREFIYDHTPLPNRALPSDGILPYLRLKKLSEKKSFAHSCTLIPLSITSNLVDFADGCQIAIIFKI